MVSLTSSFHFYSTSQPLITRSLHSVQVKNLKYSSSILYLKSLHLFPLMSSPRSPLDLNLGPPNSVNDGTSAFRPFVLSTPTFIPTNDSVMENPITALRAGSHLLTPKDQEFLARRPDHISADESLRLTIQSAASVMNLRHYLLARGVEVESLCG